MFLALALLASTAGAAPPAVDSRKETDPKKVRAVQWKFGDCVVKKHYAAAKSFVLAEALPPLKMRRRLRQLSDGSCLVKAANATDQVEMAFPADTMQYALADALVQKEFSQGGPANLKDAGLLSYPAFDEDETPAKSSENSQQTMADLHGAIGKRAGSETSANATEKATRTVADAIAALRTRSVASTALAKFGECVVRNDAGLSHRLLMAIPDSDEEGAAIASLQPVLGQCLTAGQTLKFNKTMLRGTIAANYYRLAHASPQPLSNGDAAEAAK